jgi:hypothetical protein
VPRAPRVDHAEPVTTKRAPACHASGGVAYWIDS